MNGVIDRRGVLQKKHLSKMRAHGFQHAIGKDKKSSQSQHVSGTGESGQAANLSAMHPVTPETTLLPEVTSRGLTS
jgi:hypothetical protein